MAVETIQSKDLDDKNKPQQGAQPAQQQAGGTTNFNPFAGSQQKKQKGTGFTNIGKIVQANQGNKLGATVAGGVKNVAQQARQNVQQAGQQFQQQAQANNLASNENQARAQNLLADPTKASDQDAAAFQQYASGQYAGPTGLQNQDMLQNQVMQAQSLGQAANSAGGRQALLQRFAGGPQYSAGQQRLDNVLLGATGGQQIAQAARSAQGLGNQFQQQQDAAAAQAGELTARAKAFGEDVQNQFANKLQGIDKDISGRVSQNQDVYNKELENLKQGKMTADEAAKLGLSADTNLYNVDLTKYLTQNADALSKGNVASAGELANINALKKLAGNTALTGKGAGIFDQYNDAKGGLDKANPYNIDKDSLMKEISQRGEDAGAQQKLLDEANNALGGDIKSRWDAPDLGSRTGLQNTFNTLNDITARVNSRNYNNDDLYKAANILGFGYDQLKSLPRANLISVLQSYNGQLEQAVNQRKQQQAAAQAALGQLQSNRKLSLV